MLGRSRLPVSRRRDASRRPLKRQRHCGASASEMPSKGGNMGKFKRRNAITGAIVGCGSLFLVGIAGPVLADDTTLGPNGEQPTSGMELKLSDADIAKLKAGNYTAALM